jgi:hypothetical protein
MEQPRDEPDTIVFHWPRIEFDETITRRKIFRSIDTSPGVIYTDRAAPPLRWNLPAMDTMDTMAGATGLTVDGLRRASEARSRRPQSAGEIRGRGPQSRHPARPPQVLRYDEFRGRVWSHLRRGDLSITSFAHDGDDSILATTMIVRCRTEAGRLGPGATCGCGEWYAPTRQPRRGELVLYDVGAEVAPRFVPLDVWTRELDYRRAVSVSVSLLDRANPFTMAAVTLDVEPSLAPHAFHDGVLAFKLVEQLAFRYGARRNEITREVEVDLRALRSMLIEKALPAFPQRQAVPITRAAEIGGRLMFWTERGVYMQRAAEDAVFYVGHESAPRRSRESLPVADAGIPGAIPLDEPTAEDLALYARDGAGGRPDELPWAEQNRKINDLIARRAPSA